MNPSQKETTTESKTDSKADKSKGKKASPKAKLEKPKKQPWTLEEVLRIGRQFHSAEEWYSQSPASFKSAMAHGWLTQALSSSQGQSNVVRFPEKKSSKTKPLKKAA